MKHSLMVLLVVLLLTPLAALPARADTTAAADGSYLWSSLESFDEGAIKIAAEPTRTVTVADNATTRRKNVKKRIAAKSTASGASTKNMAGTLRSSTGVNTNDNVQYGTPIGGPSAPPWAYPPYYYYYGYPSAPASRGH
jgi:hypothetical protein